jgi:hypothetical protein
MTTLRQILANQANSRSSSGPRGGGSAGNATTHGLTASKCMSEEEHAMIEARLADLERELQPEGTLQNDEVLAIATASIRLERCVLEELTWRLRRAERAELYWGADQQVEAMELVQKLPRKPSLIAPKLRQSLRGCLWMLEEWRHLAGLVRGTPAEDSPRPLDATGRRRAFDLLGLSAERRLGSTPLDPFGGSDSEAAVAAHQEALIAREVAALEALVCEERVANDESIRIATSNGTNSTVDHQTRLIRRYETEARRVKDRAYEKLQRLKELAAALKEAARQREFDEREMALHMTELDRDDLIGTARCWGVSEPEPQSETEPQPQPQRQTEPEASVVSVEDAQAGTSAVRLEVIAAMERTLAQTADPSDPVVLPVTASRPRSRRARKVLAARAAHRSVHGRQDVE